LTSLGVVTERPRPQNPAYATFGSFPSVTAQRSSYFEVVGRAGNGIIVVNTLDPAGRRGFLFLECLDVAQGCRVVRRVKSAAIWGTPDVLPT
jgi:hypothetical protein